MPLHDYQEVGVEYLRRVPRAGLFLDMGLGKTAVALTALTPEHLPALVVAPKRVAEYVWPRESAKWRPDLRVYVAKGSWQARDRVWAQLNKADIIVVSRENVGDVKRHWKARHPFRTVILDELSSFKNKKTQRWAAAKTITQRPPYVWGLTGTPSPNGLLDLWAQVYLLDRGERLGKYITHYRERYFVAGKRLPNGVAIQWTPRPEAEKRIHTLLEDICLSMKSEGRIKLPPVTYNDVAVPLDVHDKALYRTMKKESVLDLSAMGGTTHVAETAAALSSKLQQITAGFLYRDEREDGYQVLHRNKIMATREIVDGTGAPVLVLYKYRAELDLLKQEFPEAWEIHDDGVMEAWDAGRVPVLLAHPASIGHGLNLQHGGYTAVWTSVTWSLEEWEQANKRLARQGQEHPVVIHTLTTPGTVDDRVLQALSKKESVQQALLTYLESPV